MNRFNSALHVSGDKFAHPQENFLTVYTTFGTMHRHCYRPVPRLRWNFQGSSILGLKEEFYSDILRDGFEPTILVSERKKTFYALESAARVRFGSLMIQQTAVALHHLGF
jgi:hypothetical protein